jgi:hypothetical protein
MTTTCRSERLVDGAASAATSATAYQSHGWRVFPLNGKVPFAGTRGVKDATLDSDAVATWPAGCNIGIATGGGLVVIDIDNHANVDGGETLYELERQHEPLPRTASVKTGNNGEHLYFTSRAPIRNSAGRLGPGLDVRGEGGYVVAPPSVHPETGRAYDWDIAPSEGMASLPAWLEALLSEDTRPNARPVTEWRDLAGNGAPEGTRNDSCAKLAGHLLARSVDPFVCLELVQAWNRHRNRPPLPDSEVTRTVDSIARREARKWA